VLVVQRGTLARIVGAAIAIVASGSDHHAQRLPLQTYNASHGLTHDRIRCALADSRGFLWFCTADGLSRFDGSLFVNYGPEHGLPHPEVEEIVEAGPGVYWVAAGGKLARLRADADRSTDLKPVPPDAGSAFRTDPAPVPFKVYPVGSDPAANQVVTLRMDRSGRMWIGTTGGLFVLDHPLGEPRFRRVEPDPSTIRFPHVEAIVEGPDGTLWIGTRSGLFRRLPDGRIVHDRSVPADAEISHMLVDRLDRIWSSSGNGLTLTIPTKPSASSASSPSPSPGALRHCWAGPPVAILPTAPGEACRFETIAGLPLTIRSLFEGSDGHVWIATPGGLIEFDGHAFRALTERHGLVNEAIKAVGEDRAGNLWIATDAGGVARLTRNGFVSFKETDGLRHEYVTSISQSRTGRVRVTGGWAVLNEFDGDRFTSRWFGFPGRMKEARVYDVLEDHTGDLWVGTPDGLLRFPEVRSVVQLDRAKPKGTYSTVNGLPGPQVAPSFEDSRGDLWMTAYLATDDRRVVRWQRSTGRFHQYPETDSPVVSIRGPVFAEDDMGTVWVGSSRGLARHRDGQFTTVEIGDADRTVAVTALHIDPRRRLWVGTRGAGLYRLDDPAAERPGFTAYAVADGLSSSTVWCLTSDASGNVYAGTTRGVDRLEPERGQFKHFSVADGLAGSEVITAFRDRSGALWFGTLTGISRFTSSPQGAQGPPTAWLGGLRIRGVPQPLQLLGQPHVSIGTLAPHQNQVEIDYFGLSPSPGESLTYQYQLEGPQSAWSAPTPERRVNYAELAPGSYRFLVRAVNADRTSSRVPASVTFTILPPVWKRAWFVGTVIVLAIASGYSVHRYRVRRLFEMERLRTRIASDLHDDVGSSLTQISMLSEIVRTRLANPAAQIADPLARIGTLSRESVDSMSDIVWAIDPVRDMPAHLLQRMRRVANEILGSGGVQLHFASSGDASPHLNADVRRHVFLIFKEILNNIVRHANASAVSVEVTVTSRQLHFTVADNGRGFDTMSATDGQGLRSMARRASSLGGSLDVTSSAATGTRVAFTVPVR
jgi:ligand-binding sensor domain-containing protein/two-component sensor histidine kinase